MKTWGSGGIAPPFLNLTLDGDEWSASRPGRFTPGERVAGTHFTGGWLGPEAGVDYVEKRKNLVPTGNRSSAVQLLDCRYTD
jgi:hypothetical protein